MENKIERVEDEKVFCYTYDSLVRELSKNMMVMEERLLPKEGEESIGDHESIYNWIKAIDFEEGKTPAIEATFSSDGGKKTVRLDTEKLTPVGSLEEKASKEDLLYSMALTEAKMKVVSTIAEEVYPAVAFQISDYRKDMGKMRDEILENKSQTSNFNEVMHGALSRKNVVSAVVIASMLMSSNGCVVATGTAKPIEPTTSPAMTETFIPPTEVEMETPTAAAVTMIPSETATETIPNDFISINMDNVIYPPLSNVKENFEKGEYDASVEIIKRWINVWGEMGVFDGVGDIYNNGLVLIPLVGREKVTCVALKSDKYAKTLFCPPIDNNIGGLKIISDSGQEQDTDKPIIVNLTGTEGLTIRGKGNELTYQIVDKYTNKGIRYYNINTKGFVEGSFIAPPEVKENDPIEGSVVCVSKEYCMNGQMEVDQEVGRVFYENFLTTLIHSNANIEYFNNLLNGDISLEALKRYLESSNGMIPSGLKMYRIFHGDMVTIDENPLDMQINLGGLKTVVFGPKEWSNDVSGIREYLNDFDEGQLINPYPSTNYAWMYYGWFVDNNNYLVLVNGSKNVDDNPFTGHPGIIGGKSGEYLPEHDNKAATGQILHLIKFFERFEKYPVLTAPFDIVSEEPVNDTDIQRLLGGKNLFKQT